MRRPLALLGIVVVATLLTAAPMIMLASQEPAIQPQSAGEVIPDPVPPVTVAEAESTSPGVPPGSIPPSETLSWSLALAVATNELLKKLKASPWFPMIKDGAGKINFYLAGLLSLLTSIGIHTEFDAKAGTFLVTGLVLGSITHLAGEWFRQWLFTQLLFKVAKD